MLNRMSKEQKETSHLTPSQLEQLTLDFTLRKHCEKIKIATTVFKQVDSDEDGIINHEQLYVLVEKLNLKGQVDAD